MSQKYVTPKEAAELLRLSRDRVTQLCRAGKLPGAVRRGQGGGWLIPPSAVDAYLGVDAPPRPESTGMAAGGEALRKLGYPV